MKVKINCVVIVGQIDALVCPVVTARPSVRPFVCWLIVHQGGTGSRRVDVSEAGAR